MQATKPKIEDTAESLSNINNLSYLNSESIESQILIKTRWELSDKLFNILKNNKTKKIKSILDFKIIENNDVRENLINFAYYCSSRFIRTVCRSDSDSFKVEIF